MVSLPLPRPQVGLDDLRVVLDLVGRALGNDLAKVEHGDALADPHDQTHVVLNEEDSDLEGVPDLDDVLHELGGLGGVHAGGGLVQEEQTGIGCQGPDDLQPALGAVRKTAGLGVGQVLHVKDTQQFQGPFMGDLLLLPVAGQAEKSAEEAVANVIVQADLYVVLHAQVGEEADILEGTGNAHSIDLHGGLAGGVVAVQKDGAPGGLINLGKQIEDSGLTGAVGADEAGDLCTADGHVEVVDGGEAAKVNAQMAGLQDGGFIHIPLGDLVGAWHGHQLGGLSLGFTHGPCLLSPWPQPWPWPAPGATPGGGPSDSGRRSCWWPA